MIKTLSFLLRFGGLALLSCGLALLSCGLAAAQPISAGLKVGVPLTDALTAIETNDVGYTADTHRYVIGPYVDIHLPASFSLEVDALYRSYDFTQIAPSFTQSTSVSSWEFPVVLKYKMLHGPIRPYVEGGLVFEHLSVNNVPALIHGSDTGITLGAGVEIHALVLRISPEIRYEVFLLHNFSSPGDLLQSNRNQALLMVGIGF
jgi:hypothetical protein